MYIRDATEADLPTIVEIYNAAVPSRIATADIKPISVESRLRWYHEHIPTSRPLWVMDVEIKHSSTCAIAGWLSFQSFYGRPAYHATAELSIYIAPNYHRQGIGQQLLERAICQSPTVGLKTLIGFIFAHNQPSLQLFQKNGFQRWGYLPRVADLDGVDRDLVILGRRVG
ncbi:MULTISPECIES: GNAT family N-acetyltransferase [unclassified Coleofasciculus]|uniref:GNAT family N-acetyltransferase n=1 Tax=unclassified Coleofasciculus TaxID=2692782 RepID=UPI001883067E|nr:MULTISPECIES: GNAT family N-acetyltransferase [unclassified Coleofasciculus]MBE9126241.1 N-acetyltransferase [Coleofasciculus sp. LEGE 07081]MBE9148097.1 N-acetyltransferase [Coleofasciculus sp. LEGE 07092]